MSPWAPAHPCTYPGCHELVKTGSRCEAHQKQEMREYNGRRQNDPTGKIYPGKLWRDARKYHLANEPLCRICREQGRLVAGSVVDHITPIKAGGDVYDDSNLRTLCPTCHSRHHAEQGERWGEGGAAERG